MEWGGGGELYRADTEKCFSQPQEMGYCNMNHLPNLNIHPCQFMPLQDHHMWREIHTMMFLQHSVFQVTLDAVYRQGKVSNKVSLQFFQQHRGLTHTQGMVYLSDASLSAVLRMLPMTYKLESREMHQHHISKDRGVLN